jgi:multiple antibiotic resistance protein
MNEFSYVLTISFVLLGPVKIIPAFARLAHASEPHFNRELALKGALTASALCLFVILMGRGLIAAYRLSLPSLRLGGGLVLLLSALNTLFPRAEPRKEPTEKRTPLQVAISPLATPIIVPPAGVAALLIFVMSAPESPGTYQTLALALLFILTLDFLVMFFNDRLLRVPGLFPTLQVLGSVLTFAQVALAIETMLGALHTLGVFTG